MNGGRPEKPPAGRTMIMELIRAAEGDLQELLNLYERVAAEMEKSGLLQWHWGVYPTEEMIRDDVAQGLMYIQRIDGVIAGAVAVFNGVDEPEYAEVPWTCGVNPGYFHRLAVDPAMQGMGIAGGILDDVQQILRGQGCDSVRCDTNDKNARARRLYEKMGFSACGPVVWDDTPGEAYTAFDKSLRRETPMWPVRMVPAFRSGKATPWGGGRLKEIYGKDIPETPTGESLEVSCIPGLESRDPMGRTLPELIERYRDKMAGRYADRKFPLLLKLIDARLPLSVQVHPNDAYARLHEDGKLGKNEAWLILDTPAGGGELVYGIQAGTGMEELRAACLQGKAVEPLLRRVKVKPGDICYIPAGCVHAIGAGILLYEIQESSDLTYRFYDWDRVDENGNRRELHLKKGLDVTNLKLCPRPLHVEAADGVRRMLDEENFTLDVIRTHSRAVLPPVKNFGMITLLDGELNMTWTGGSAKMKKGETFFLPGSVPEITVRGEGTAALSMPK